MPPENYGPACKTAAVGVPQPTELQPPTLRTVNAVLAEIYEALRRTVLFQGILDLAAEITPVWVPAEPWVGQRSDFVRPTGIFKDRAEALLNELIRPLVASPLLLWDHTNTTEIAEKRACKIDEIIAMLGAVCVLCGVNPPHGDILSELRPQLEHLLAAK